MTACVCGQPVRPQGKAQRPFTTCGQRACIRRVIGQTISAKSRGKARETYGERKVRGGQPICECGGPLGDRHPNMGCVTCQAKTAAFRERNSEEDAA